MLAVIPVLIRKTGYVTSLIYTSLSALRLAAVSILSRRRVSRNVDGVHVIFPIILHQGVRVTKLFLFVLLINVLRFIIVCSSFFTDF